MMGTAKALVHGVLATSQVEYDLSIYFL